VEVSIEVDRKDIGFNDMTDACGSGSVPVLDDFEHCSSAPRSTKGKFPSAQFSQRNLLDEVSLFRYFRLRGSCFHFACSSRKGEFCIYSEHFLQPPPPLPLLIAVAPEFLLSS
jgi:hypothetical protein